MQRMNNEGAERLYKLSEIADRLAIKYKTLWKWCRIEKTVRVIVMDSGSLRIPESEVERLLTQTEPK